MQFQWDEAKNAENIHKHKIDFADVPSMFAAPMLVKLDDRQEYDEDRWIGIGLLSQIIAVIVWVERHEDVIRIISARKANRTERNDYEQLLTH